MHKEVAINKSFWNFKGGKQAEINHNFKVDIDVISITIASKLKLLLVNTYL